MKNKKKEKVYVPQGKSTKRNSQRLRAIRRSNGEEVTRKPNRRKEVQTIHMGVEKHFFPGIYYLYRGKEVVYVGMSEDNCMKRVCDHYQKMEKDFDSYKIFNYSTYSRKQLLAKEKHLIKVLDPEYNKTNRKKIKKEKVENDVLGKM